MHYDSAIIVQFAARLYKRADTILISYTFLVGLLGLLGGGAFGMAVGGRSDGPTFAVALGLFVALLGAALGFIVGREKAFAFRLQAQIALCQVQIEGNTRTMGAAQSGRRA